MDSVIEVVANLLKESVETTFIPRRIDRCPECDSEKMVFPESRARKRRPNPEESTGAVRTVAVQGLQSGCAVVVTRDGKQPGIVCSTPHLCHQKNHHYCPGSDQTNPLI